MKVAKLKGLDSYYACQAYNKLVLGLKMLPAYYHEDYTTFVDRISKMPFEDQEKVLREAAIFVKLDPEEFMSMAKFTCDANGVPFDSSNVNNLTPDMIHEIIVAVSLEILKIPVRLIPEAQKKN